MKTVPRRYLKTALSVLLIFSLLTPYAEAAIPGGIPAASGAVSDTAVPIGPGNEDYQSSSEEAPARSVEELKQLDGVILDDSGRAISIKGNVSLSNAERAALLDDSAEPNTLQDGEESGTAAMLMERFDYTETEVEAGIRLHGSESAFQSELYDYQIAAENYSLDDDTAAGILSLISGGYTNSQAFAAYIASDFLGISLSELRTAKEEDLALLAEAGEDAELENMGHDGAIDALATIMGVPYSVADAYMAESEENAQDVESAFRAAKKLFYFSDRETAAANTLDSEDSMYTPQQILDKPFSYDKMDNVAVNLNTGTYQYSETDLSIPGVNGLDLNFTRRYDLSRAWYARPSGMNWDCFEDPAFLVCYKGYIWTNSSRPNEMPVYEEVADLTDYTFWDSGFDTIAKSSMEIAAEDYAFAASERDRWESENGGYIGIATENATDDDVDIQIHADIRPIEPYFSEAFTNQSYSDSETVSAFGLGNGWELGFSHIDSYTVDYNLPNVQRLTTFDGKSYNIEEFYQGRAYFSDYYLDELQLEKTSGGYTGATYTLTYKDGRKEYFDAAGRNIAIEDRYGNRITLEYTFTANSVTQIKITDTLGNIIIYKDELIDPSTTQYIGEVEEAEYAYNRLWTLSLNGNVIRRYYCSAERDISTGVEYKYQRHVGTTDAYGNLTKYDTEAWDKKYNCYISRSTTSDGVAKYMQLQSISYPNGLTQGIFTESNSQMPYERLGAAGYVRWRPARKVHLIVNEDNSNKIIMERNSREYTYGDYGHLYTAMSSDGEYEYQVKVVDRQTKIIPGTGVLPYRPTWAIRDSVYTFNEEQLMSAEAHNSYGDVQYEDINSKADYQELVDGQATGTHSKTTYNYDVIRLPSAVSEKIYDENGYTYRSVDRAYTYDLKGNIRTETLPNGQTATYTYNYTYSIPLTKTYKQDDATTIVETNTLTADGKGIAAHEVMSNGVVTARTNYAYDSLGRLTNQRVYTDDINYTEQTFAYNASAAPTERKTLNVKSAQGAAALGSPGYPAGVVAEKMEYNEYGLPTKLTDANGNETTLAYDLNGRIIRTNYPSGAYEAYVYDDVNSTVIYTDRLGTVYRYQYDAWGNLTQVYDVARECALSDKNYDTWNRLILDVTHRTSGEDIVTAYRYDFADRVTDAKSKDASGAALYQETYVYADGSGKTTKTIVGDANAPSVVTTSYTDVMGNTVKTGRLLNDTELTDTYTYDYLGNCTQSTSAYTAGIGGAFTTKGTYDYAGRALSSTNALNETALTQYDWQGNRLSVTDPKGNATLYTYDALGRLLTQRVPFSGTDSAPTYAAIRYTYDPVGNVTAKATLNNTPAGVESWASTEYAYDGLNQLVRVTGHADVSHPSYTQYYYDKAGNTLRMYTGQTAPLTINGLDRVSGTVDSVTKYGYDAYGNQTSMTDPLGKVETVSYDLNGLPLTKTDRNGNLTEYSYDAMGRTESISVSKPAARIAPRSLPVGDTVWLHSAGEWVDSIDVDFYYAADEIVDPNDPEGVYIHTGRQTDFLFTSDELPLWAHLVSGESGENYLLVQDFDEPLGNLFGDLYGTEMPEEGGGTGGGETGGGDEPEEPAVYEQIFTYTATGQKRTETNGDQTATYTYDSLGRPLTETVGSTVKSYAYNKADLRTAFILVVNNVQQLSNTYGYDTLGRLVEVSGSNVSATYGYDANGNQSYVQYGNGLREEYAYNKANLVTQVANKKGSSVLSRYDYSYLLDGNQSSKTELDGTVTSYTYDGLGRLLTENAVRNGVTVNGYAYTYDSRSNRASMVVSGAENLRVDYTYDKANRLTKSVGTPASGAAETTTYTYDDNGNRLTATSPGLDGTVSYGYDGFNRQTRVTGGDHTNTYTYGPGGLRTGKTVDGVTTDYVWDGQQIVLEQGSTATKYLRGMNLIASVESDTKYYLYNAHGDVVQLANSTGTVTKEYKYDAFGVEQNPSDNDTNPFRYCGEQYDSETGNIYLRARYYDVGNGRFTTEDTYTGESKAPLTLNLYTYCLNNSIRYMDATGNAAEDFTRTMAHWLIANPITTYATQEGWLSGLFYLAGFIRDSGGIYHARPDAAQQVGGYNDFYDTVFYYATSMDKAKFQFTSDGRDYIFWAWKGDYLNLGAGAELGIYSNKSGIAGQIDITSPTDQHWLVDTSLAMTMTLTLSDSSGNQIFSYTPSEKQWWVTGFNPYYQGVQASNLTAVYTVTFNNSTMYNDFKNSLGPDETRWTFNSTDYTATFKF